MAKVKVKNLRNVQSSIRKFITLNLRKPEARKIVGDGIVKSIKERNFGAPARSTRKWRARYDSINITDPTYERNKINITFTGELLNDLSNNVKSNSTRGRFVYIIENSNKLHKRYNGVSGKIGSRVKYSTISDGIINKNGYNYLDFEQRNLDEIYRNLQKFIESNYKNF